MSSLPKLFHRSFVIGFLLPSILFFGYIDIASTPDGHLGAIFGASQQSLLKASMLSVILAIFLIALNRPIIRFLEGYGKLNPLRVLMPLVRYRFRHYVQPIYEEAQRVEEARKTNPKAGPQLNDFAKKLAETARAYPDREDLLLPTKFGNVYRAFEVYSRVTYALDAIPAWPRLQMLLPSRVNDQLRDARSVLDFTVNIFILSIVSIVVIVGQHILNNTAISVIHCVVPGVFVIYAWLMLPASAQQWGEVVRSIFDLYRKRLARELGLQLPANVEEERIMWREVSRLMIFRTGAPLITLQKFRDKKAKINRPRGKDKSGESVETIIATGR